MCRHTGVTLQELLLRLTPLASRLEVLDLSDNQLGGTNTTDITVFSTLKKLNMSNMGLDGKPLSTRFTTSSSHLARFVFAQFRTKRRQSTRRNSPIAAFTSEVR